MQEDKRLGKLRQAAGQLRGRQTTTIQINGVSITVFYTISALKKLDYVNFVIESSKSGRKIDCGLLHIAADVAEVIYFTDLDMPMDMPLCQYHDLITDCGLLARVTEIAGEEIARLNRWVWEAYEAAGSVVALFDSMETSEELIAKMKAAYDSLDPAKLQEIGKSFRYVQEDFEPENLEDILSIIQEKTTLDRKGAEELLHSLAMTAASGRQDTM